MKKHSFELLFITLFLSALISCNKTDKVKEAARIDSLKNSFVVLKDSLDATWTSMMNEDDQKLDEMKQLLKEVTNTNMFDEKQINELNERIDNAKANRFNQESMENQDLIDEYDFAINSLIKEIETLATSNPVYSNYPVIGELLDEIKKADGKLLLNRIHYDSYANDYNLFLKDHMDLAKEMDPNDSLVRKNVFQIAN